MPIVDSYKSHGYCKNFGLFSQDMLKLPFIQISCATLELYSYILHFDMDCGKQFSFQSLTWPGTVKA